MPSTKIVTIVLRHPNHNVARFVEELAITLRLGQKLTVAKRLRSMPKPRGYSRNRSGCGPAGSQTAGRFLIKVLGKTAAHIRDRTAHIGPAHHDRKVADIGRVLLLEVKVQPLLGTLPFVNAGHAQ